MHCSDIFCALRHLWRARGERAAGGGLAQGLGIGLFAFGGAYWPLATAHSDPQGGGVNQKDQCTVARG